MQPHCPLSFFCHWSGEPATWSKQQRSEATHTLCLWVIQASRSDTPNRPRKPTQDPTLKRPSLVRPSMCKPLSSWSKTQLPGQLFGCGWFRCGCCGTSRPRCSRRKGAPLKACNYAIHVRSAPWYATASKPVKRNTDGLFWNAETNIFSSEGPAIMAGYILFDSSSASIQMPIQESLPEQGNCQSRKACLRKATT